MQHPGAPPAGRRRRRRGRPSKPSQVESVPLSRVTVVSAERLEPKRAERWLAEVGGDPERRVAEVREATLVLNRALHALRAAARDPLIQDVGASRALAIRIGFGTGEEVADGRWTEATQLPPPPRALREEIDPQQRVAAVLSGREGVEPAETLLLRAQLDLEQGRTGEASHGLDAAEAALADADGKVREEISGRISRLRARLNQ